MNLSNRKFELVKNFAGHASVKTIMIFSEQANPFAGTYTGPNTIYGQVIVRVSQNGQAEMLYQSLTSDGELVSGHAQVSLHEEDQPATMQLNWQWLTGLLTSGVSIWEEITTIHGNSMGSD